MLLGSIATPSSFSSMSYKSWVPVLLTLYKYLTVSPEATFSSSTPSKSLPVRSVVTVLAILNKGSPAPAILPICKKGITWLPTLIVEPSSTTLAPVVNPCKLPVGLVSGSQPKWVSIRTTTVSPASKSVTSTVPSIVDLDVNKAPLRVSETKVASLPPSSTIPVSSPELPAPFCTRS